MKPAIDLTRHHFMRPMGDLVVFGTWVYNNEQEDHEPALVIVPRYRRDGFKPCCVALSSAYKYNTSAQYLAQASAHFVRQLGMADCMASAHLVADAIHSHLGDLVSMPPNPTSTVVVAEASIDVGGAKRTIELLDFDSLQQY